MGNSGSTPLDLAIGINFIEKLLHVKYVGKENYTVSEIFEPTLQHLLADGKVCHDSNSTENVGNPDESNLDILKSSLKEEITYVRVYSNPLRFPLVSLFKIMFHAFVVFATRNTANSKELMWWSLEKNGKCIVMQQSKNRDDVVEKLYDAEKEQRVDRHGRVKIKKIAMGNFRSLQYLLRVIWETNQISKRYHLLLSNCQHFASFIFEKSNGEGKKWSVKVSDGLGRMGDRLRSALKKKSAIQENTVLYNTLKNNHNFELYRALMEGWRKDFEELINDLTIECLNSIDSQGYTLLEWATVFSSSDWPIAEELKKKCNEPAGDKELFNKQNLFFIALQYLPPNKKSKYLSLDGVDIHGVNGTGDTALHLALYGGKREIAKDILRKLEDDDVNSTNSLGETPLHLAAQLKCGSVLFTKILQRTNPENINKADDGRSFTALHYAIEEKSKTKVKELLNHENVDFNVKNDQNVLAFHLASKWTNIPKDLLEKIEKRATYINAHNIYGNNALNYKMLIKSETVIKEFLKYKDVNITNNKNVLALLHCACISENIPMDLFQIILEKSDDINAQNIDGWTGLQFAIFRKCKTKVEKLLEHENINVNKKNKFNVTALHLACSLWKDMPNVLFKKIRNKSADINAQDEDGNTALHIGCRNNFQEAVTALLEDDRVDVNVKNNENRTALDYALDWKWPNHIPDDVLERIRQKSIAMRNLDDFAV